MKVFYSKPARLEVFPTIIAMPFDYNGEAFIERVDHSENWNCKRLEWGPPFNHIIFSILAVLGPQNVWPLCGDSSNFDFFDTHSNRAIFLFGMPVEGLNSPEANWLMRRWPQSPMLRPFNQIVTHRMAITGDRSDPDIERFINARIQQLLWHIGHIGIASAGTAISCETKLKKLWKENRA